ncbi:MAG: leucyl aminopeptidase family protein, partial [Pseudomonadales bacterium]
MKYLLCFFSFLLTAPVLAQQFEFQPYSVPEDGRLVILVEEESLLAGPAGNLDALTVGALTRAMAEADFTGKVKSTLTLYGFAGYARIDLVGAGKKGVDRNLAEDLGGVVANLLKDVKGGSIQVLWDLPGLAVEASAARFAFGYLLRSYRFDRYQEDQRDPGELPLVRVYSKRDAGDEFANDLMHIADGVFFARDVSSEPANVMYPQAFVDRVKNEFKGLDNVRIRVLDEKDLQQLNMGAHWGVGKGSSRPPRLLIIEYMGGSDGGLVALAGKGITFDTGGISLKRNDGMWAMKGDLGGAGVVTGTVLSAARRGAEVNVVALAALAENMPSGTATRPGDVLTTMSGTTVEIRSTDAEGRLVLSDA